MTTFFLLEQIIIRLWARLGRVRTERY